jgi:hypothetical protein
MGKASSNKKVARAATTGGGRTTRGRTPWLYYGALALAVLVGVGLIWQSRDHRITQLAAGTVVPPRLANPSKNQPFDHWHVAYGFYICDAFQPDLPDNASKGGIHTHTDGLIHVEPVTVDDAGPNATVGRFVKLAGVTLTEDEIKIPGQNAHKNGDKCGDKKGVVKVFVDGKLRAGDPHDIKLTDQAKMVFAFVPEDTDSVPEPPSVKNLENPNAGEGGGVNPEDITTATTAPGSATTAPGTATTASTAPATTATTAKK